MYQAYWGLSCEPFAAAARRASDERYFAGAGQQEALARLRYIAGGRRRLALLVGQHGAGKSLLLGRFAAELRRTGEAVARISAAALSPVELAWQFAAALSLGPRQVDHPLALFRQLRDYAAAAQLEKRHAVLLLDDVDQAGPDLLAQATRLLNIEPAASWLTMVLATHSAEAIRLGSALLDAADMRIDVEPWDQSETIGYVQHALLEAGSERPLFADAALAAIFAYSAGLPRRVHRIAERSLVIAAVDGAEQVDAAHVEEAAATAFGASDMPAASGAH